MSIVDKMAKAIHATESGGAFHTAWEYLPQQEKDWYRDAAQAAWDVVKAEMMGDDFRLAVADKYFENGFVQTTTEKFDYATEALSAAMQKLEE